jgi:hypothetical protein
MARPGKTKQLQVSVPKWVYDKLKEWAEIENRSLSNFVATILIQYIKANEKSQTDLRRTQNRESG